MMSVQKQLIERFANSEHCMRHIMTSYNFSAESLVVTVAAGNIIFPGCQTCVSVALCSDLLHGHKPLQLLDASDEYELLIYHKQ